ncbi:MAG: ABC transporter ATP-binding protein [Planctomycetota bacterium]
MTTAAVTHDPAPSGDDPSGAVSDAVPAIEISGLSYTYKSRGAPRQALDQVDLTVMPGQRVALLGPNGSGKSTLLKLLCTALPLPDQARMCRIAGADLRREPQLVRQRLAVVFQHPALDIKLTARENLTCHGRLYGLGGSTLRNAVDQALNDAGLADRSKEYVESFSGGMRRRVELAKALMTDPAVLLLDEPSTGLDPAARRQLWQRVREAAEQRGVGVLLSTHLMDEAEPCDRVAVMHAGRIVAFDSPQALTTALPGDRLVIEAADLQDAAPLAQDLAHHPALGQPISPHTDGPIITLRPTSIDAAEAAPQLLAAAGSRARSLTIARPSLEDAYLHLTGQPLHQDAD